LPKTDSRVIPSSGTTEMYSLDQLTDSRPSSAATAVGSTLGAATYNAGTGTLTGATGTLAFAISVDSGAAQTINYTLKPADSDPEVLAKNIETAINNVLGALPDTQDNTLTPAVNEYAKNARYGTTVKFDPDTARFSIASGTTGDTSSIAISAADAKAVSLMGLGASPNLSVTASTNQALRGKPSEPAVLSGEVMTINTAKSIQVTSSNKDFFVSVDGIATKVEMPFPTTYSNIDTFAKALQDKINTIVDSETGRKVQGVTVAFDPKTKQLNFTTGTTGSNAAIQVSGAADWGLANTEMQFGTTTE